MVKFYDRIVVPDQDPSTFDTKTDFFGGDPRRVDDVLAIVRGHITRAGNGVLRPERKIFSNTDLDIFLLGRGLDGDIAELQVKSLLEAGIKAPDPTGFAAILELQRLRPFIVKIINDPDLQAQLIRSLIEKNWLTVLLDIFEIEGITLQPSANNALLEICSDNSTLGKQLLLMYQTRSNNKLFAQIIESVIIGLAKASGYDNWKLIIDFWVKFPHHIPSYVKEFTLKADRIEAFLFQNETDFAPTLKELIVGSDAHIRGFFPAICPKAPTY